MRAHTQRSFDDSESESGHPSLVTISFITAGNVADFGELSGNGGKNYRTALVNNMAELAGTPKSAVSVHIIVRMCVCVVCGG